MVVFSEGEEVYGFGLCKAIRKRWVVFQVRTNFEVGDGRSVRFWHGLWSSGVVLRESFPILFSIASLKDAECTMIGRIWEMVGIGFLVFQEFP